MSMNNLQYVYACIAFLQAQVEGRKTTEPTNEIMLLEKRMEVRKIRDMIINVEFWE